MTNTKMPEHSWTIAYRNPRANRFLRVTNWNGTWHQAVEVARAFGERHPDLQVYYVTNRAYEAYELHYAYASTPPRTDRLEDHGNILVDSGRRVRTIDRGEIPADELAEILPGALRRAHNKILDGYFQARANDDEPNYEQLQAVSEEDSLQDYAAELVAMFRADRNAKEGIYASGIDSYYVKFMAEIIEAEAEAKADTCGVVLELGPDHDPSGSECELLAGHTGTLHLGRDPFGGDGYVEWNGGGRVAGDRLPATDIKFITEDDGRRRIADLPVYTD